VFFNIWNKMPGIWNFEVDIYGYNFTANQQMWFSEQSPAWPSYLVSFEIIECDKKTFLPLVQSSTVVAAGE
jgi:hypothetical protein